MTDPKKYDKIGARPSNRSGPGHQTDWGQAIKENLGPGHQREIGARPLRLYWISPRDVRKNRADPVKIMLESHAFAQLGLDVRLITPHVHRPEYPVKKGDIWRQYGLTPSFQIVELPTFYRDKDTQSTRLANMMVRMQKAFWFGVHAMGLAARTLFRRQPVLILSQCYTGIVPYLLLRKVLPLPWHIHFLAVAFLKPGRLEGFIARNAAGVLAINDHIRRAFVEVYGLAPDRVYRPAPYSYLEVMRTLDREAEVSQRASFDFSGDRKIVGYIGKLGYPPHEEIDLIVEAASKLPQFGFALIGGNGESEKEYERLCRVRGIENIQFLGFQPLLDLHHFCRAVDLLVSYYPSSDPLAANNRVPAKFSIYTCARKPIIAADFPGIREALSEDEAFLIPPDRPDALVETIEAVLQNPEIAEQKAARALQRAETHSISNYCRGALDFMRNRINAAQTVREEGQAP